MGDFEVRRHYFLKRYALISHKRKLRPKEFDAKPEVKVGSSCVFCPGNEDPELEVGRVEEKGKWVVRWVKNKYPALAPLGSPKFSGERGFLSSDGFGYHEVIIDTPKHGVGFHELNEKEMVRVLQVYQNRYTELSALPGIRYVVLFKNSGPMSGASIVHEHSQVIAQGFVPSEVRQKILAARRLKSCPYCNLLKHEPKSKRRIVSDNQFAAFCPYAPRFSNEVWLVPKRHVESFPLLKSPELVSLARMLKHILNRLLTLCDSYNLLFFSNSPDKQGLHFHIEVCPRSSLWAGYEFASSDYIISTPPEESAEFYRG